jgi:hypothetical protein
LDVYRLKKCARGRKKPSFFIFLLHSSIIGYIFAPHFSAGFAARVLKTLL